MTSPPALPPTPMAPHRQPPPPRDHTQRQQPRPSRQHSKAVRLSGGPDWIAISGLVASDAKDDESDTEFEKQVRSIFASLGETLDELDVNLTDVVRLRVYMTDLTPRRVQITHDVRREVFEQGVYPVSTLLGVASLVHSRYKVEVEADAVGNRA